MERISRDEMFMEMAKILSKRSTCQRSQVGALIVNGGRPISGGYNGPVSGAAPCGEIGGCLGAGCDRSIHAELNSILFAARAGISVDECTMYCTMAPCVKCAQAIVNAGIRRVVYGKAYRKTEGLEFLMTNMVQVEQVKIEDPPPTWIDHGITCECPHCHRKVHRAVANGVCPYCFTVVGG